MNKKSILAETLAEIKQIKEGIDKNANHVLKSTLKDDLEAIVRKGLNEAVEDETLPQPDDMAGDNGIPADPESMGGSTEELPGAEPEAPIEVPGDEVIPGEETPGDELPGLEPTTEPGEPEVIDLTGKSDDEVLQHFNLINPADEIEIVQTPEGGIQITLNPSTGGEELPGEEVPGAEAIPGEETPGAEPATDEFPSSDEPTEEPSEEPAEEPSTEDPGDDSETSSDDEDDKDKTVDESTEEEEPTVDEDVDHVQAKASLKHTMTGGETIQNSKELQESLKTTRQKLQTLMTENKTKTKSLETMTALVNEFKSKEAEYKAAIKNLKGELQEVALYTSNLSYIVKLLSENTTTRDEKHDIIKRFDKATTLTESREIFNSLENLFTETRKTAEQTIEERVLTTPKASGASNLNESTAYKNPQLDRIKDIMAKMK